MSRYHLRQALLALAVVGAGQVRALQEEPQAAAQERLERLDPVARRAIRNLPFVWRLLDSTEIPAEKLGPIGQRLGARLNGLSNARFSVLGRRIQVNTIVASSKEDARTVHQALGRMKDPAASLLQDSIVVEFVCQDMKLIKRARFDLGFEPKPKELRFKVSYKAAPIRSCSDYMAWNPLFNAILTLERRPGNEKAEEQRAELVQHFRFGDRISLRTGSGPDAFVHRFVPEAKGTRPGESPDIAEFDFEKLPLNDGIPSVQVQSTIVTRADGRSPGPKSRRPDLVAASAFWPVEDPKLVELAGSITAGQDTRAGKVKALLAWLRPGKNLKYSGRTGSRWGVAKVLEQGYGHCWDFADCFVTLCRASGIPARQVFGWIYGSEGHVWAEVLLDGSWKQVDPTGGGLVDPGVFYLPFTTSEDGRMSLLYLSLPEIEILEG